MKRINFLSTIVLAVLLMTACQKEQLLIPSKHITNQAVTEIVPLTRTITRYWADCKMFNTTVTPVQLTSGAESKVNQLYVSRSVFRDNLISISSLQPGDPNYMGLWHVNMLKKTVDAAKYRNACSLSDFNPADFEATGIYVAAQVRGVGRGDFEQIPVNIRTMKE
jgi:hypothetical protein